MKRKGKLLKKLSCLFAIIFLYCVTTLAADEWECSECESINTGNFCMNCGSAKEEGWYCSECGEYNQGNFCGECGNKKEDSNVSNENEEMTLDEYLTSKEFTDPDSNYALVTVEGTPMLFYLSRSIITDKTVYATFNSYTPLGKELYQLEVRFDADMKADTYSQEDFAYRERAYGSTCGITLWYSPYSRASVYGFSQGKYKFTIDEISDDWKHFQIHADIKNSKMVGVAGDKGTFSLMASFNVGEANPVVEAMKKFDE